MPNKSKPTEKKTVKKERKAYPDRDTRIAMAEAKIEQLEKLNAERRALIEKTAAKLEARRAALASSEEQLAKAVSRRDRLIAAKSRPAGTSSSARNAEKAQIAQLKQLLASKGKTIDYIINSL